MITTGNKSRATYKPKSRLKWNQYVRESFTSYRNSFTKEDLKTDYDLVSSVMTAVANHLYEDYSISSRNVLSYSTRVIKDELGIKKDFFKSLRYGKFITQKNLETIFSKVAGWHREELGDLINGLDYDRKDKILRSKLYSYQDVLYKIQKYAELRGIRLFDGKYSSGLIKIGEDYHKISDIIKKDYDNNFPKQQYKEFHLLFQLAKYVGFDPLTFTVLKDSDMATSRYRLHHYLADLLRKMSSNVVDIVLTNVETHMVYEKILRDKGREGEFYIRALMETIQELIRLDVPTLTETHIKDTLVKNLGEKEGIEMYYNWRGTTKDSLDNFRENLQKFNDRRIYAQDSRYEDLLVKEYKDTWNKRSLNAKLYISKFETMLSKLPVFFSYQPDLDILNQAFSLQLRLP